MPDRRRFRAWLLRRPARCEEEAARPPTTLSILAAVMDEDTEAAAWHQISQEEREREERCRQLQRELIDETKVFDENNRAFWQRTRSYV